MMDRLRFKAHKKLDGSTGLVEFFFTVILRLRARNIGDNVFDYEGTLFQRLDTTRPTRWNLHNVFPLLMRTTGLVDFAFDTGLMICLRDDREEGELQFSFKGSLMLQLAVEGLQSLLFLASQIQNEHSI